MSTLTISSPGVQINEVDLSIIARPLGATDVLVTGFAQQGPTEELTNIGSVSEFESVFGTPTNAAERYLYYTSRQILSQSPANLMVSRIPYGTGLGDGYTNSYSALVYPLSCNSFTYADSTEFRLMPPQSVLLNEDEYNAIVANNIAWNDSPWFYEIGTVDTEFGPLTNESESLDGIRIFGKDIVSLADLAPEDVLNIGLGVSSLSAAYYFREGTWLVYTDDTKTELSATSSIDNWYADLDDQGLLETVVINNWYPVLETDSETLSAYQEAYGDPIYTTETVIYNIDAPNVLQTVQTAQDLMDGAAGLIVLNTSKTAVNDLFEGYYVGISDHNGFNPADKYESIQALEAVNGASTDIQPFVQVPQTRLSFSLTQEANSYGRDSLSKVIESYPVGYEFNSDSFRDSLVLMLFKVRSTQYNKDTVTLDYVVAEGYSGSLYENRKQNNQNGGNPISYFIDTVVDNKSSNVKVITNPFVSSQGTWTEVDGTPAKSFIVDDGAKVAYSTGVYQNQNNKSSKDLGQVDQKLARILNILSNDDTTNIDIIVDGGLSTIWSSAYTNNDQNGSDIYYFDEDFTPADIDDNDGLGNTRANVIPIGRTVEGYQAITQLFVEFAEARRDHVFISDPLRQIFVQGRDGKVSARKSYVFSSDTYWPLNNLYNGVQSSYVTAYGNWIKANDIWTSKPVWLPASGYAASIMAKSSQQTYPWIAPAGFNRGTLTNVLDLGVNPTQKQRDLLYKINVNPIAYFNQDGFVIFGQKTMYRKPSAFDRINVRRLFLTLEKEAQRLLKYYVFEPNDFATRNRLKGALVPIFDQAKLNDGCYDYLLVCDTTNNTPDVIDNNELKISIYIQPVRAAEFILADFIATRTGVNFSELIAGGQS
jgi:hypothetical protein